MGTRPNPDGWKGGPEEYDTVWQSHGHRIDAMSAYIDQDDPETGRGDSDNGEKGYTRDHSYPNDLC